MDLRMKVSFGALALALAVVTAPAFAADKMASPQILASNCFNCHGLNGTSVGIMDDIDHMPARRITQRMQEFKAGTRPSTIMGRIAKGYSDAEIEAMANYFEQANKR